MKSSRVAAAAIELAGGFDHPDLEELPRIVPLVHGLADVESFVALQADERRAERGREDFRDLGFADARFAFEKQRAFQPQGEVDRDCKPSLGDVLLAGEGLLERVDGSRNRRAAPGSREPGTRAPQPRSRA